MWIFLTDAFFSIVEDKQNATRFVVRARIKEDLPRVFGLSPKAVEVDGGTDYKYRAYLSKDFVIKKITEEMESIDYTNFKSEVTEKDRSEAYSKVWGVLFNWQEKKNPLKEKWYTKYRDYKYDKYNKSYSELMDEPSTKT